MNAGLVRLLRQPEERIDLVRASLLIAREEYPDLDVERYRRRVRTLVARARDSLGSINPRRPEAVDRFNAFFFAELGFHGNRDDYYDPRNSYLNDVLDRRVGIPITLSVVYAEIGRRAGLPTVGIGFPAHFLVRCGTALVDCFNGHVIDRDGCQKLLDDVYGGDVAFRNDMLHASTPVEILARMLNNLRGVYAQRREFEKALRYVELAMAAQPDRPDGFRDRGLLRLHMEEFGRAVEDFEQYMRRAPAARDLSVVLDHLKLAQKLLARVN